MNKNDLTRKSELAEQLGMKFEEASELFSNETLESMRMVNVVGGGDDTDGKTYCDGAYCTNCVDGCDKPNCPDKTRGEHCGICIVVKPGCPSGSTTPTEPEEPGGETTDPETPGGTIPGETTDPTDTMP